MKKIFIILLVILSLFIILIVAIGIFAYYAKDLVNVKLEKTEIEEFKIINSSSFSIKVNLYVNNPSKIAIPIKAVNYRLTLEDTNDQIGLGAVTKFTLKSSSTTKITINHEATFPSTLKTSRDILTKENVFAVLDGKAIIDFPIIRNYPIPFSFKIDVKEYLVNLLKDQFLPKELGDINLPIPLPENI